MNKKRPRKGRSKSLVRVQSKQIKDSKKLDIVEQVEHIDQKETKGKRDRSKSVQRVNQKSKSKKKI